MDVLSSPRAAQLGIIGAGRVARAIGQRWLLMTRSKAPAWSRRLESQGRVDEAHLTLATIDSVMSADTVVAAIPSRGLVALAERYPCMSAFSGQLIATGIDLHLPALQKIFPAALVIRVIPALLAAPHSITALTLSAQETSSGWERARALLEKLGPVHYVSDERALECMMYLMSAVPIVLRRALTEMLATTRERNGLDEQWQPLAERVLWQALTTLGATPERQHSVEVEAATPGGVTEAGLRAAGALAHSLDEILQLMVAHRQTLGRHVPQD